MAGTRVSLDSVVYAFLGGHTAESIAQSFPVLTLEQVYGAITSVMGYGSLCPTVYGGQVQGMVERRASLMHKG